MNNVLIEIKGGMIQQIYANDARIHVHVIDYDNIEQGDEVELSPYPTLYTCASFREFFTENSPLEQEIHNELQRLHL